MTITNNPVIIDSRNCLDPRDLEQAGFVYIGIGKSGQTVQQLITA